MSTYPLIKMLSSLVLAVTNRTFLAKKNNVQGRVKVVYQ